VTPPEASVAFSQRAGTGGRSPRDTLTRDLLPALDGDHEIEVAGFDGAQKQRSRGERPPAPTLRASSSTNR